MSSSSATDAMPLEPPSAVTPALDTDDAGWLGDLRGASRLAISAVSGVTDLVEDMHGSIVGLAPVIGQRPAARLGGISGFVYGTVRAITRGVGGGIDLALAGAMAVHKPGESASAQRDALRAVCNGVLGDYLHASANPLATPMHLRHEGARLVLDGKHKLPEGRRLLILLHGLCMNDLQWRRKQHEHGSFLADELDYTRLYLRYNSGRALSENACDFAALMQTLQEVWPQPLEEIVLLGHSMGGLVAHRACAEAHQRQMSWAGKVSAIASLGTPFHGAALERAGHRFERLLAASPYSSPFMRIGGIRSAGITDLRHGLAGSPGDLPALPSQLRCFAVAASRDPSAALPAQQLSGDGLVSVCSALGEHPQPELTLALPDRHKLVVTQCNHFDLLGRPDVGAQLAYWLRQ